MSILSIRIDTDNAAFYDDASGENANPVPEVARLLREYVAKIEKWGVLGDAPLIDINGNKVGNAKIFPDHRAIDTWPY